MLGIVSKSVNYQERLNNFLSDNLKQDNSFMSVRLLDAMNYSLLNGGKRIRANFVYNIGINFGIKLDILDYLAAAIEVIHTFSLIHDDLPALDNDDYRRGKEANHIKFDEATAILAGDSLIFHAFYLLTKLKDKGISSDIIIRMINYLSLNAGHLGLVGGELMDIEAEGKNCDYEQIKKIYILKTAYLIKTAFILPSLLVNKDEDFIDRLSLSGENLGIAFQIQDDLLAFIGDKEKLGKPFESDQKNNKSTIVSVMGIESSIQERDKFFNESVKIMAEMELHNVIDLAYFCIERKF